MKSVSLATLGIVLASGGVAALAQTAAPTLAKDERAALFAADAALQAKNYAVAAPAVSTAVSTAHSGYARYLAASLQLKLGLETGDRAVQARAIQAMIESGAAPQSNLEELYKNQGAIALGNGDIKKAEDAFDRWAELAPNNGDALVALAEAKSKRNKPQDAVGLIERAIAQRQAAGQPVPESYYKRGLKQAFDAKMPEASLRLAQGLVRAYPSPQNWRDALMVYRDLYHPDAATGLDTLRLARSAKALTGERDYLEYAEAASSDAYAGERKALLDEGVAVKMVDPAKPAFKTMMTATGKKATAGKAGLAAMRTKALAAATGAPALAAADAYYGYGDYAKAAELYRAAIEKGSIDANVANTRLGMALALSGQRAEAETAWRSVTGPRAALASYWLLWVAQRQTA